MTTPRPISALRRGFTLVEMLVGVLVSAIVVAGSITLLVNQQQAYQNTANDRAGQEAARVALGAIGDALARAGYGIHPSVTFDFGTIPQVTIEFASTGTVAFNSPDCAAPVTCRDSTAGSDQIAFYARDPYFVRALAQAPTTGQLVVAGGLRTPLYQGQVLAVACMSCGKRFAYVTVGQPVAAAPAAATTTIPLLAAAGGGFDFPTQNSALTDACFGANLATATSTPDVFSQASKVFKVDRYRFYTTRYLDPDSGQMRPFLMLDQGLVDANGPILTPVAPDVDDLQFAYVLPTSGVPLVGATPGVSVNNDASGIDLTVQPPLYGSSRADPSRVTQSPANIRAVRVSVVVRSPETDITLPAKALTSTYLPAAGNRPEIPSDPGNPAAFPDPWHWRALFETTVIVPNMASRLLYCGDYFVGSGAPGPNVGGG